MLNVQINKNESKKEEEGRVFNFGLMVRGLS
jgi:hypothetical protein